MAGQTLKQFIEEKTIHIDKDVFEELWNIIEGPEWIPLERQFVKEYFKSGCSGRNIITNFYTDVLIAGYTHGIDYKQRDPTDVERKAGKTCPGNTLFYSTSRKTLITMLCRAKNPKAMRYLEYFYELQNLVVQYYKMQHENSQAALASMMTAPVIVSHTRAQRIKYADIEFEKKQAIGIVYFIHEDMDMSHFKIGCTYQLLVRIRQLQTGSWRILKCYRYIYCSNPYDLEQMLHENFTSQRVQGEWFALDTAQIDEVCNQWIDC